MTTEEKAWCTIAENPKYEVSNMGDVRHKDKGKILKQKTSKYGYKRVCLSINGLNGGKLYAVHRLVAKAFIPNPSNLPQVNHKDGNKSNNKVENLEWVTAKENARHAVRIGLMKSGDKSHRTIVHKNELVGVFGLRRLGLTYKQIGEIYNVQKSTIRAIINSKRHLKDYEEVYFENKVSEFTTNNKDIYNRSDKMTINHNGLPTRIIIQKDKSGNVIQEFESITTAAQKMNVLHTSIVNNLKGRSKTCGGYIYEYKYN